MSIERIAELSERQAQCLRLLGRGLSAKLIAAELALSPETVHAHLKAARRTLRVGRSADAARLLLEAERPDGLESVGTHQMGIAAAPVSTPSMASRKPATATAGAAGEHELREARTVFLDESLPRTRPPAAGGRRFDDLTPARRSVAIAVAMVACIVVTAGLAAVATSLQRILWSIMFGHN